MITANNAIPIWEKVTLSYEEAATYSGIGAKKLRLLCEQEPDLIVRIGNRSRIKRKKLEEYIMIASDL